MFMHPFYIVPLVLMVIFLIIFYYYTFRKKSKDLESFVNVKLKDVLLKNFSIFRQQLKAVFLIIGIVFIFLALMRPRFGHTWQEVSRRGVDIILALDISNSMLATDISPNRLERARRKIIDFLQMTQGDRLGMIFFSGAAFLQVPLTLDYGAIMLFMDSLKPDMIPVPGTNLSAAIDLAVESFDENNPDARAIILMTDGENFEGDLEASVKKAKDSGVVIYTIGIGAMEGAAIPNPDGSLKKDRQGNVVITHLDEEPLQKIALDTGGRYVRSISGDLDLEQVYESIKQNLQDQELSSGRIERKKEQFQWFVFVAVVLLLLETLVSEQQQQRRRRKFS